MATQNYLSVNKGVLDSQLNNVSAATGTDLTTGKTDLATFLSDYDAVGAAIVAISGDTYSATTHQFTNGGSTGLTSAQLHTQTTALNTALTAFLAGQAIVASIPDTADFILAQLSTHTPDRFDLIRALEMFRNYVLSNGLPAGHIGTDLPSN